MYHNLALALIRLQLHPFWTRTTAVEFTLSLYNKLASVVNRLSD
jgi:hypothetical protein